MADVHRGILGLGGDRGNRLLGCVVGAGASGGTGLATLRRYLETKLKAEDLSVHSSHDAAMLLSEGDCSLLLGQVVREVDEERRLAIEGVAMEILKREMGGAIESVLHGLGVDEATMLRALQPGLS